ncbi:MAG TPA: hypothetical protein VFC65_09895 [Prolixibacteraceae bacterium]|nr:hypothetical protein [Prolixibacteraceae bacterium]
MKTKILTVVLLSIFMTIGTNLSAQERHYYGDYGNTLNLGLGIGGYSGYYGYVGHSLPVFNVNYEFDVANNFTLAPFISLSTYRSKYNNYYYHETIIPIGVKGSYYFDDILNANSNWDFYLAGSLGFSIVNSRWDDGYGGDKNYYNDGNPLFLDLHLGTEYHLNNKVGLFLDLSTGVSTVGIAIH